MFLFAFCPISSGDSIGFEGDELESDLCDVGVYKFSLDSFLFGFSLFLLPFVWLLLLSFSFLSLLSI